MIKLKKTIVGADAQLLGFILEGKEKEFGGVLNSNIERALTIQNLKDSNFSNSQISFVDGRLVTHNNFKINTLPMCMYDGVKYVDVDNTVNLTKRFVKDNENIGFEVEFSDGTKKNLVYSAVGYLTSFYKPGNFVIRVSSHNKYFISGKPGVMKLSDLPMEVIGTTTTAKKTKSGAKDNNTRGNSENNLFDILDIYDFVEKSNGAVIKLQSDEYTSRSGAPDKSKELELAGFKAFNIGEVAGDRPSFNPVKLNVNAPFKQPGSVYITTPSGNSFPVTSYVNRLKSIFYNGENNMKSFGLAIPADKHDELMKTLGSSLAISEITDPVLVNPFNFLINSSNKLRYYSVDTSNIGLISAKRRENSILTEEEIIKLIKEKLSYNLLTKALNNRTGFIKEYREEYGDEFVGVATEKKLAPAFCAMSSEALESCTFAGLNIYNGEFKSDVAIKNIGICNDKGTSKKIETPLEDIETVEIEYVLKGYNIDKITYKVIKDAVLINDDTKVPKSIIDKLRVIMVEGKPEEQLILAKRTLDYAEAKIREINKKLWLHNASMFINGDKVRVHTHNKDMWELNASSKMKSGKEYIYTGKDAEGLALKLKGVEI